MFHDKALTKSVPPCLCLLSSIHVLNHPVPMEELIARLAHAGNVETEKAREALGVIFAFMQQQAPAGEMTALFSALPGSEALATEIGPPSSGGMLGGLMALMGGGGVMALGQDLMSRGFSLDQIGGIGRELLSAGREAVGVERMQAIIDSIPGLSRFA
jgi:hypothetical protein